ncbi:urease subunit beta [Streptomyces tubbatahanensis]|uniref:Urease subunit beta n=1 Tax=Streptomyces tubbatahanensis TaxID=2923272 RepID=A0ABY3Y1K8_9ACTN|nr:urease subunit beta [Streptomyces tubbatahanensis]UNT00511.1 urease subunit beta [Streptomyces tubbatahanensis]
MIPGEVRPGDGMLSINTCREKILLAVVNEGDRPIQVGSHLHFSDANPALSFDRTAAESFRLDIPSGTSVRFEPGFAVEVPLVRLGGHARVPGIVVRDGAGGDAREPGRRRDGTRPKRSARTAG